MSVEDWVKVVMPIITSITNIWLSVRNRRKDTQTAEATKTPIEKANKAVGQNVIIVTRRDEKIVFGGLVLMAVTQIYLSGIEYYILFSSAGPFQKRHLLMSALATFGLFNAAILIVLLASGTLIDRLRAEGQQGQKPARKRRKPPKG